MTSVFVSAIAAWPSGRCPVGTRGVLAGCHSKSLLLRMRDTGRNQRNKLAASAVPSTQIFFTDCHCHCDLSAQLTHGRCHALSAPSVRCGGHLTCAYKSLTPGRLSARHPPGPSSNLSPVCTRFPIPFPEDPSPSGKAPLRVLVIVT